MRNPDQNKRCRVGDGQHGVAVDELLEAATELIMRSQPHQRRAGGGDRGRDGRLGDASPLLGVSGAGPELLKVPQRQRRGHEIFIGDRGLF